MVTQLVLNLNELNSEPFDENADVMNNTDHRRVANDNKLVAMEAKMDKTVFYGSDIETDNMNMSVPKKKSSTAEGRKTSSERSGHKTSEKSGKVRALTFEEIARRLPKTVESRDHAQPLTVCRYV